MAGAAVPASIRRRRLSAPFFPETLVTVITPCQSLCAHLDSEGYLAADCRWDDTGWRISISVQIIFQAFFIGSVLVSSGLCWAAWLARAPGLAKEATNVAVLVADSLDICCLLLPFDALRQLL